MKPNELAVFTDDDDNVVDEDGDADDVHDDHQSSTHSQQINSISNPFIEFLFHASIGLASEHPGNNKSIIWWLQQLQYSIFNATMY